MPGCAVYKFQLGKKAPFDKGYVVSRDNYAILEYTIGSDNTVPDIDTAKKRFQRRRETVEYYYKKMGYIENNFKRNFWNPCWSFLGIAAGVFRLPFIAIADYKYEHNLRYKKLIDKRESARESLDISRIEGLKERLNDYIEEDLRREDFLRTNK